MEIRVPRIANWPAAVIPLKGVDRLGLLGLLGHVHPAAHSREFRFQEMVLVQRVPQAI
jgi:hypothetical protein